MAAAEAPMRAALLEATALLLEERGPGAITTRAVCAAVGVQAPTLYHHFGGKDGLLDALIAKGLQDFLGHKAAVADSDDALTDLASGWERFIGFALDRPRLFRLLVQRLGDKPDVVAATMASTERHIARLQADGRLLVQPALARNALLALSNGVTLLWAQGVSREEIEAAARLLMGATLERLFKR